MNTQELTLTKWALDAAHSELKFKVRHMMIAHVTGSFNDIQASLEADDELKEAKINFIAKTGSINTGNEQRDVHLKSIDFFDSEKYPELRFESTRLEKKSANDYILHGKLTIKDVTKDITLDVEHGGTNKDPWGNIKNGFSIQGKINRKDFGLNWNLALETGGVIVSDEVKISGEIELVKAQ